MQVTYKLDEKDLLTMHDILSEVAHPIQMIWSPSECNQAFHMLPDSIKGLAARWGIDDTEFRDEAYSYLKNLAVTQ